MPDPSNGLPKADDRSEFPQTRVSHLRVRNPHARTLLFRRLRIRNCDLILPCPSLRCSCLLSSPRATPLSSPGLRLCAAVPPRLPGCRHARRIGDTTRRDREAFVPRRTASARSGGYEPFWSRPYYSAATASGTSARAALAQSTSFCTVGAPL